jgi:hypothetical protein
VCTDPATPPLQIFGTAGARALSAGDNKQLWTDLTAGVKAKMEGSDTKFEIADIADDDIKGLSGFRTISGDDEGLFAMLSANIITGKIDPKTLKVLLNIKLKQNLKARFTSRCTLMTNEY